MTFVPTHTDFLSDKVSASSVFSASGTSMKFSSGIKREKFAITSSDVGERTGAFLRRLYPERTADNVAADLAPWDIKPERVAAMLQRQTGPGAVLWLALIWAYGPEFLADVHPAPLGWLSAAARQQKQAELEAKIAKLNTELEKLR